MGQSNPPKCRSQKVRIIKCKSRADRSKPVGLLVRRRRRRRRRKVYSKLTQ